MEQAIREVFGAGLCLAIVGVARMMDVSLRQLLREDPSERMLQQSLSVSPEDDRGLVHGAEKA